MKESLYITPPPVEYLSKEAGVPTVLSEDEPKWVGEIVAETFRAFPFLSGYDVRAEIIKSSPETGVGSGRVVVRKPVAHIDMVTEETDTPLFYLPFVIRGLQLAPLDLATDGDLYFPASQKRMERKMLDPTVASVSPDNTQLTTDTSYFSDLIPPGRSFYGAYPGTKTASLLGSALDDSAAAGNMQQVAELQEKVAQQNVFVFVKAVCPEAVEKLASCVSTRIPPSVNDTNRTHVPTVMQFEKMGSNRVRVIHANREHFHKIAEEIPAEAAQEVMPPEAAADMEEYGFHTMPTQAPVHIPTLPKQDPSSPIASTGEYLVFTPEGDKITGWATPNTLGFDGQPRDAVVFANGTAGTLQPQIAGIKQGSGHLPPTTTTPKDLGFFLTRNDGDIQAYGPVQIQGTGALPDGSAMYSCVDAMTGTPITLQPTPEILRVVPLGEAMFGIPQVIEFLPMGSTVELLMPGEIMKTAQAAIYQDSSTVSIACHNGLFNIDGPPVEALHELETHGLNKQAAHFLLVSCGTDVRDAKDIIKKASRFQGEDVLVPGRLHITRTTAEKTAQIDKIAADIQALDTLKPKFLVNEAAHLCKFSSDMQGRPAAVLGAREMFYQHFKLAAPVLPKQETVDSILSLGLVNQQTASTFIREKPMLEKSLSTLCSLLLYTRIGMPGIPELVVERCIDDFDQITEALDMLPFNLQDK